MKKSDFIRLHMDLTINLPKTIECNVLPSDTDPTQDIPIKMIQLSAAGVPINVKKFNSVFSNLPVDQLTSIEKRNMDKFDVYGEFQQSVSKVAQKGVTTNFIKPKKTKTNEK